MIISYRTFENFSSALLLLSIILIPRSYAEEIATGKAEKNALYQNVSPYLAMHGRDPVHWREWNEASVRLAREQDKMLFVSSGYFSCHWCHVMQRESYQNNEVAALLNKYFVPVKVDRELNSPLDAHLIDFVERTQGYSGWPLNTFVTPEGYPLVGFTYAPPEKFIQILKGLEKEWREKKAELKQLAKNASTELSTAEISDSASLPAGMAEGLIDSFVNRTFTFADELQGGFGQENKFPSVPQLDTLLTVYKRKPDAQIKQFLKVTLGNMTTQGLRDQLDGGFFRYAVDPGWQVPHFEKMLYDNALLASLYYRAAIVLDEPGYRDIANQTLDFILRELDTSTAAYAASLSAIDKNGVEGGYYLWDAKELTTILTESEWKLIRLYWGLDGSPDLEHGHHLAEAHSLEDVAKQLKLSVKSASQLLESARAKMLAQRAKRSLPKDDKILTSWNGLVLSALVKGAKDSGEERFRLAAKNLADFIRKKLWDQKTSTLYRATGQAGSLGEGTLEDYAYVSRGLFGWWQVSKDPSDRKLLDGIIRQAWKRFYGHEGWHLAENMLLKYGSGQTMVSDGPIPSPSSLLIETSFKYATVTKDNELRKQALQALNVGFTQLQTDSFWYASQVKAILAVQK